MKKVLFPFEMKRTCYKEAYVYAVKVARNLGAELILLAAFDIETDNSITKPKYDLLVKNAWIRAYQDIILFHDYYLNNYARVDSELRIKVDHRFIHGNLVDEFHRILHAEKIDLVVLPAIGEDDSARKKLKQMRHEALDLDPVSLLLIPCDSTYRPFERILFASVLRRLKGLTDYAADMSLYASIYNSVIHFLHFSRSEGEAGQEHAVLESFRKTFMKNNQLFDQPLPEREMGSQIQQYIAVNDIHMMAIPKQQLLIIGDAFRGGIIEELGSRLRIPLLILRQNET